MQTQTLNTNPATQTPDTNATHALQPIHTNPESIPAVLRNAPNWCLTMPNKHGKYKIPATLTVRENPKSKLYYASVTNPSSWLTYAEAVEAAKHHGNCPIGIVLTADLNVTCIDIDTGYSKAAIAEQLDPEMAQHRYDFHQRLLSWLNRNVPTYTERSASGYNHHVFIQHGIGDGIRLSTMVTTINGAKFTITNAGVEIYSQERFIVMTGDTVNDCVNIEPVNIDQLLAQATERTAAVVLEEVPQVDSDTDVLAKLLQFEHNKLLWAGTVSQDNDPTADSNHNGYYQAADGSWSTSPAERRWDSYDHPLRQYASQSDADCALMIALCKLTPSNEQCRRLFLQSGLGQREKARNTANNYIERTLRHARGVIKVQAQQRDNLEEMLNAVRLAKADAPAFERELAVAMVHESAYAQEAIAKNNGTQQLDGTFTGGAVIPAIGTLEPTAVVTNYAPTKPASQLCNAEHPERSLRVDSVAERGAHGAKHLGATANSSANSSATNPNANANAAPKPYLPMLVETRKREFGVITNLDVTDLIGDWYMLDIGLENELAYPPGLVGEYARWVYNYSPQPMVEACITHALSVVCGIGGNTYKINPVMPTGINQYFILMALSATGKDILHSGMGHLRTALADTCPEVLGFIDHSRYKSEAALSQGVANARFNAFVHLQPEFSKLMHSAQNGNANDEGVLNWMLSAYSYSSLGNIVAATRRSGFANAKEGSETRERPHGFGYSMVGECTETDLNKALNGGYIRDGKLSRFVCIRGDDYLHITKPTMTEMSVRLKSALTAFIKRCIEASDSGNYIICHATPDAQRLIDKYHHVMVDNLNATRATDDDPRRAVYARARLKVWKIAGALAALENPESPLITAEQVFWVIGLINRDIKNTTFKIVNRIIGDSADINDRMDKLRGQVLSWIRNAEFDFPLHNKLYGKGLRLGIIPMRVLRESNKHISMFKHSKTGNFEPRLLAEAINALVAEGYLRKLSNKSCYEDYNLDFKGELFQLDSLE